MSLAWQDGGFQGTLNHTNDQSFILKYCKLINQHAAMPFNMYFTFVMEYQLQNTIN